mmetsp:Transcript_44828/g.117597  ORF Transcript_44828/g.117597 Transcript_44828/m.117597 type:complete len:345 (+) Transcript_44828:134-1168(+)|eukprot:CAMPEP_0115858886 /NCGR_PEP_ID=MMETSP0287-20121206/16328_1 /TAXON_ID=412157 /ORGANISM="Chrysochromulina rotalis, Strain UIO044" /LENGTH=344 /DNA_ID=CAMNT_0003313163 /DNA_START=134 /DNA_END=1168 /DNA_ORIENTATION=+
MSSSTTEELLLFNTSDEIGAKLRGWLAGNSRTQLEMAVSPDGQPTLHIDGVEVPSSVRSLPTVVEMHKSIDGATYFKAGEIGRVILTEQPSEDASTGGSALMAEHPHGITPPAADIRKRRWRKRPVREVSEVEQVAVELEALRGGSLRPDFELVKIEEEVPLDVPRVPPPAPVAQATLKMKLVVRPQAAPAADQQPPPSAGAPASAAQPPPSQTIAPLRLSLPVAPRASAPPPRQPPAIAPAPPLATIFQHGVPPSSTAASSAPRHPDHLAEAGALVMTEPRISEISDAARQQAQAELRRIEENLAKFRNMLARCTNHEQKKAVQLKVDALMRERDTARERSLS